MPGIVEAFNALDVEYGQKIEEEKAKAPTAPAETQPPTEVATEPTVENVGSDSENIEAEGIGSSDVSDDVEEEKPPIPIILVLVLVFMAVIVIIFSVV
jgi:hypothetical protein